MRCGSGETARVDSEVGGCTEGRNGIYGGKGGGGATEWDSCCVCSKFELETLLIMFKKQSS